MAKLEERVDEGQPRLGLLSRLAKFLAVAATSWVFVRIVKPKPHEWDEDRTQHLIVTLSHDKATLDARIQEEFDALDSMRQARLAVILWPWEKYKQGKRYVISAPGRGLGALLRRFGDGGESFCRRTRYCYRRSKIERQHEELKQLHAEAIAGLELPAAELGERVAELIGFAKEAAKEVGKEIGGEVGDAFIFPLVARGIYHGLEDICRCCEDCGGSGHLAKGGKCPTCKGKGRIQPKGKDHRNSKVRRQKGAIGREKR